jgi:hypothetical protein
MSVRPEFRVRPSLTPYVPSIEEVPTSCSPVLTLAGCYTSRRRRSPNRTQTHPLALIKRVMMRFCAVRPAGMSRVEQKKAMFADAQATALNFVLQPVFDPRGLHYMACGANIAMTATVVTRLASGFLRYSEKITRASRL